MNILDELDTRTLLVLDTVELADGTLVQITQSSDIEGEHTGVVFKRPGAENWMFGAFLELPSVAMATVDGGSKAMFVTPPIPVVFDPNKECPPDEVHLISSTDFDNENGSVLRFINEVHGTTYCGGTQGQIYRLTDRVDDEGKMQWDNISPELEEGTPPPLFGGLTGFGDDDLYAVGMGGAIWHWDGAGWSEKESPTDYILTNACTHGEHVYACGVGGMLLKGRGDSWEIVSWEGGPNGNLFAIGSVGDTLVVSSEFGQAYKLVNGKVESFPELWGTMSLRPGPSGLWSSGRGGTHLFDGETCQVIVEPAPEKDEDEGEEE